MLHREGGQYEEGAVEWWEKLRGVFGEKQVLEERPEGSGGGSGNNDPAWKDFKIGYD